MKTKIIPFDLETAKKIQAGEVEGRIVAKDSRKIRVMTLDAKHYDEQGYTPILVLVKLPDKSEVPVWYRENGTHLGYISQRLAIELPEESPKHELKPFARVLARDADDDVWRCEIFSHRGTGSAYSYVCASCNWNQCIPYEGNEHLLGTTCKPEKEHR